MGIDSGLLNRVKSGIALSDKEKSAAINALKSRTSKTPVHQLIRALAQTSPPQAHLIDLAEDILKKREDDWWVQGALYALCDSWGRVEPYLEDLFWLIRAENWDQYSDSGIAALSILGSYAHKTQDPAVYHRLHLALLEDQKLEEGSSDQFWPSHLQATVSALDQAYRGMEALTHPIKVRGFADVPSYIIQFAERRASKPS